MMNRYFFVALFAVFALQAESPWAASPGAPPLKPATAGGVVYLVGGTGDEEELAMQAVAGDYSLLLAFTEKGAGGYVAGVQVTLKDAGGKTLVDVKADAPCFFARLAPGRYSLSASYEGRTEKRSVDVKAKKPSAIVIGWEGPKEPRSSYAPGEASHLARGCWR